MNGFVSLVGAGPGDAGLLTARAVRRLGQADVVVYDRLISPRVLMHAKPQAQCIYVGKAMNHHTMGQDEINRLLVQLANAGHRVVRVKGGDPFVFGRGSEEAAALVSAHIPFEVVPGVTSALSAPAYAGIPVTHRDLATGFSVLTGHLSSNHEHSDADWQMLGNAHRTLVFLMGVGQLHNIVDHLLHAGRPAQTPIALVRYGARAAQQTVTGTLADIEQRVQTAGLASPAAIVVGDVVKLHETIAWAEERPLFGLRLVVAADDAATSREIANELEDAGAEVVDFSTEFCAKSGGLHRTDGVLQAIWRLVEQPFDAVVSTSITAYGLLRQSLGTVHEDLLATNGFAFDAATAMALRRQGMAMCVIDRHDELVSQLASHFAAGADRVVSFGT